MATMTTKLAKQIHDEFLICKICFEVYKNPKCLNCLHTFCERCIEDHICSEAVYKKYSDYRDFTCPLCRKRTQLPIGGVRKLCDNFLVSSLSEIVGRQRPSVHPWCDICKLLAEKNRQAASKCLDCVKFLCTSCADKHRQMRVTSGHSLFDVEIEKDINCKEHTDEVVRFYCEPCSTCICVICTFHDHKDHEITQFSEAVDKYKTNIVRLVKQCQDKIDKFDLNVEALVRCEQVFRESEQKIHDTAIEYIQEIRSRERQLIEELRNVYGPDCMEYIDNRQDLSAQMETLRNTCQLTEHILDGKNIELLLLKNDVEEKLAALNDVSVPDLPSTVDKVVQFVSGSVDMGYLYDMDRPLVSGSHVAKNIVTQDQMDAAGANEAIYHNQRALQAALAKLSEEGATARRLGTSVTAVVTEATQTECSEAQRVSRATQTDPPTVSPQPVRKVQSMYRKPEQSSYSKPARFG